MSQDIEEIKTRILDAEKNGYITFHRFGQLIAVSFGEFLSQSGDEILRDLNRMPANILENTDNPNWINDYAMTVVIRKLKESLNQVLSIRPTE
jgi:hypothetical protein